MTSYAQSDMTMDIHSMDFCAALERMGELAACSALPGFRQLSRVALG